MKKNFIIAIYNDEEKLLAAAHKAKDRDYSFYDIYTPFPVHGLDDAMSIRRSFLPYITFGMGVFGCAIAIATQIWMSAVDWPINVGGKPFNSFPAFIPVSFELTVFFAAHMTVLGFLAFNRLYPGKKPVIFHAHQTSHSFVIVHEKDQVNLDEITKLYMDNGAVEVKEHSLEVDA